MSMVNGVLDLRDLARPHMPAVPDQPHLTGAAQATWRGRMVNEYQSASVFEGLARQLAEAGFAAEEVAECQAFADEERRHGVLCGAVVEALGGEAVASVPGVQAFPEHRDVPAREGIVRNLLSISCMSETVAVALIGAERLEMPDGPLRDLLTGIWSDEIGHARFGWRVVARETQTMDAAARARLGDYLAVAFAHVERHELGHLPADVAPPPEGAELGLCSGADARTLFYDTIRDVIIPRLEELGLPARAAWQRRDRARAAA